MVSLSLSISSPSSQVGGATFTFHLEFSLSLLNFHLSLLSFFKVSSPSSWEAGGTGAPPPGVASLSVFRLSTVRSCVTFFTLFCNNFFTLHSFLQQFFHCPLSFCNNFSFFALLPFCKKCPLSTLFCIKFFTVHSFFAKKNQLFAPFLQPF